MFETHVDSLRNWGIALLRVAVGGTFVAHGAQKLFVYGIDGVTGAMAGLNIPLPELSAWLATGAELVGGLLILVGLATRVAAVPVAFTMIVAALTAHSGAYFLPAGMEYVLVLLAANIALMLTGPGAAALDNVIARRPEPALQPVTA